MKKTAIVIDDEKNIRMILCKLLEILGIEIAGTGSNGQELVELYLQHNPDFIFTDIMMPQYDGFFGIEKINTSNTDSKIIAVTGDPSLETKQKLEKLGVLSILYKPFSISSIKDIINS